MKEYQTVSDRWRFLEPWTAALRRHSELTLSVHYPRKDSYCCTVDGVDLSLDESILQGDCSPDTKKTVVEAIKLLCIALQSNIEAWRAVLREQCGCKEFIGAAISNDVDKAFRLCVMIPGTVDSCWFFDCLVEDTTRSERYQIALQNLKTLCDRARAIPMRTSVQVRLVPSSEADDEALQVINFAEYVLTSNKLASDGQTRQFAIDEAVIESISISSVQHAINRAPGLRLQRLVIEPDDMTIDSEDLRASIGAALAANPNLEIDIRSSQDVEMTRRVFRALRRAAQHIEYLHIAASIPVGFVDERHSAYHWQALLQDLLCPNAGFSIDTLALTIHQSDDEVSSCQDQCALSPSLKMPRCLALELTPASAHGISGCIQTFQGVHQLQISDSEQVLPSSILPRILETCTQLESLDLDRVVIDSMDIFSTDTDHSRLSSLSLSNVGVRRPESVSGLFARLALGESTLREFRLVRSGDPSTAWDKFVLSTADLSQAKLALEQNRRLQALHLHVADDVALATVEELASRHCEVLALRRAPLSIQSKLALLSAVRFASICGSSIFGCLGHDPLGHIFEFAAECETRWIDLRKSFEV